MEFLDGVSVRQAGRPLDLELLELGIEIADALHLLHIPKESFIAI